MYENSTLETIMTRKSTRKFLDKPIPEEDLRTILKAAMSGPTAVNARDWQFIVVQDKATLEKMAEANGPAANPLKGAAAGILICGDLDRAFKKAPDFWIVDGSIAGQNICLAAESLGIGCVWLGTWPTVERVENQAKLFDLPKTVVPHSIFALGYPDGVPEGHKDKPEWEEDRIHFEKW